MLRQAMEVFQDSREHRRGWVRRQGWVRIVHCLLGSEGTILTLTLGAPPGMPPPGMSPAPGIQQVNSPAPGLPGRPPAGFPPPAGMGSINFSAPVIRLGTSNPAKADMGGRRDDRGGDSYGGGGRRAGLGMGREGMGGDQQRQPRDLTMLALAPPTREETARTIFVGNITEGVGGDEGLERILRSAGNLRRWQRAYDADNKPCTFGFAEYEDAESLETAATVFEDVQIPVKRPKAGAVNGENGEAEKSRLLIVVDDASRKYAEEWRERRNEDESAHQFRVDSARQELDSVLSGIMHPQGAPAMDGDGDTSMADGQTTTIEQPTGEVVTIPLSAEDELSDIPAEMRETVAAEIAAFRDRSIKRDLERLKKEEEMEAAERLRAGRPSRIASPPATAPSGPAGGANGIPVGPRGGVQGAPSGPKGYTGAQLPKDYQAGVNFVNGTNGTSSWLTPEEEDDPASDEELERRRREKKEAELEKTYLDYERRWLNRERTRTAALEREKAREAEEAAKEAREKEIVARRLKEWNDDIEATRRTEEYYIDRSEWLRNRAVFKAQEEKADALDRAEENRLNKANTEQTETDQARAQADSFLDRTAEELSTMPAREPARFKMSLGAAATQRAQQQPAGLKKRTAAEVEAFLEDEEETDTTQKRTLIPIQHDPSLSASASMTDAERSAAQKALAQEIPSDKDALFAFPIKWEHLQAETVEEQIKPFVEKKIVEYLGVQEQMLVDVVEEHIRKRGKPDELVDELQGVMEDEAEVLVKKLWRMLVFFSESDRRGLSS